jgi:hypothetical protein
LVCCLGSNTWKWLVGGVFIAPNTNRAVGEKLLLSVSHRTAQCSLCDAPSCCPVREGDCWRRRLFTPDSPVLSGTIIRGTPKTPKSQLVTPISTKLQRPDGCDSGQGSVHPRDMISPRPSPASGKGSRPRRIHDSPEGPLKQRTHLRLARGPARTDFTEKQPWPDRHADRPYRRSI